MKYFEKLKFRILQRTYGHKYFSKIPKSISESLSEVDDYIDGALQDISGSKKRKYKKKKI